MNRNLKKKGNSKPILKVFKKVAEMIYILILSYGLLICIFLIIVVKIIYS